MDWLDNIIILQKTLMICRKMYVRANICVNAQVVTKLHISSNFVTLGIDVIYYQRV